MDVRWRYVVVVGVLCGGMHVCVAPSGIIEAPHVDEQTNLDDRDSYEGNSDLLDTNPGQHGRIELVNNHLRTSEPRVFTTPVITNNLGKHPKANGPVDQKLPVDTKTTPLVIVPNRLPVITTESMPPVLSEKHVQTVLGTAQDLAKTIDVVKEKFRKDVFSMRLKVTDLISNNFFSEKRVSEMQDLLEQLALDKSSLDVQLAELDKEILAMHIAFSQLPNPDAQMSSQLMVLQANYQRSMRVLQECIKEALDLYQNLAYTLASAQQDILNKDFFIDVYDELRNSSKARNFFTASKRGALATSDTPVESLMAITERTVKVVVAEEAENILDCFFLAQELGKLSENLELLRKA